MEKIKKIWPVIFIGFIVLIISCRNYIPGTWLTGWDNLNPEFNFSLNIQRSIFSVWQEYQGLGSIGGLAYASDLVRQIILWIINTVLPTSSLRYVYTFAMLLIGPLGIFVLLKEILLNDAREPSKKVVSLVGALYYLLNLVTVQIFFTPFDSFIAFYGFFPWVLFSILYFLKHPNKKKYLFFILINILAISQFYISTTFIVFLISIGLIILGYFIEEKRISTLKSSIKVLLTLFIINAFWLLPFLYFTLTHISQPVESHMNNMSTEDIYLRNKQYGNLANVALLRGFAFSYVDKDASGSYSYLMNSWREHMDKPYSKFIGFSFFLIILLGLFYAHREKRKYRWPFTLLFIFSFMMLANDTWPFSDIIEFFRANSSLFAQVFRVPFTKFSNIALFSYSIFFSYGFMAIFSILGRLKIVREKFSRIITIIIIISLGIYVLPIFNGELFYYKTRIKIPDDYFHVMDFFNKQVLTGRIAVLPQFTYWGWNYYKWGYGGSGFFWYGIKNPTLDRAFDGYRRENENYYWEISSAIYSNNLTLFNNLVDKYQIQWLIFDENIIGSVPVRAINFKTIQDFIGRSKKVQSSISFGKIKVYKLNIDTNYKDFVYLADSLPTIGPGYKWGNLDKGYEEYGTYVTETGNSKLEAGSINPQPTTNNSQPDIFYPFRSLFTGRQQSELEFGVTANDAYFSFKTKIPKELVGYKLTIPALDTNEVKELDASDLDRQTVKTPEIYLDGEFVPYASDSANTIDLPYIKEGNLEVRAPKISGYYSFNTQPTTYNSQPKSCDQFNQGIYTHDKVSENGKELLRLTSIGSSNCLDFDLPNLSQDLGYLVSVENRNIEGKSLLFSVINKNSQRADIETYLPAKALATAGLPNQPTTHNSQLTTSYFIIPPMEEFGIGYSLHLDNISIGRVKTVNDLGKITVNPIPYRLLTNLKIVNPNFNPQPTTYNPQLITISHPNPSLYQITYNKEQITGTNTTLVLSQSFDSGWKAYDIKIKNQKSKIKNILIQLFPFFFGQELKDHVLVNNWENGWRLQPTTHNPQPTTIIIVYLPQYLEYIGFILLGVGILIVVFYPRNSKPITHNPQPITNN